MWGEAGLGGFGAETEEEETWQSNLVSLAAYIKEHNSDRIPLGHHLREWVQSQRQAYRRGELDVSRQVSLASAGLELSLRGKWREVDWECMLQELKAFRQRHGHCRVPDDYFEDRLLQWVKDQRQRMVRGTVSMERQAMLEEIGFEWHEGAHRKRSWMDMWWATALQLQKHGNHSLAGSTFAGEARSGSPSGESSGENATGDAGNASEAVPPQAVSVPVSSPTSDESLAQWATQQQGLVREGRVSAPREALLESVNLLEGGDLTWDELWLTCLRVMQRDGNLSFLNGRGRPGRPRRRTPSEEKNLDRRCIRAEVDIISPSEGVRRGRGRLKVTGDEKAIDVEVELNCEGRTKSEAELRRWVKMQAFWMARQKLSVARQRKIALLGFEVITNAASVHTEWLTRMRELVEYRAKFGNCCVPATFEQNPGLSRWVHTQRMRRRVGKMSNGRARQLEKLGFNFEGRSQWEKRFSQLIGFCEKYGHVSPSQLGPNRRLGVWVAVQRVKYRKGQLRAARIQKLNEIGFTWELHTDWDNRIRQLRRFKAAHGHCNVPQQFRIDDPSEEHKSAKRSGVAMNSLGTWVTMQRMKRRQGKLSQDQLTVLESLDFSWGLHAGWDERYRQLIAFRDEYGHVNVPQKFENNKSLGAWVAQQRRRYKRKILSRDKVQLMESAGLEWELRRGRQMMGHSPGLREAVHVEQDESDEDLRGAPPRRTPPAERTQPLGDEGRSRSVGSSSPNARRGADASSHPIYAFRN